MLRPLLRGGVVVASICLATTGIAILASDAWAAKAKPPVRTNSYVQVTLKQQLEKGLKCRRPVEFEFVDRVTKMVEEGKLPIKTVNIAFAWSRKRDSFQPFMYFEKALIELAARDKIKVEPVPLVVITPTTPSPFVTPTRTPAR